MKRFIPFFSCVLAVLVLVPLLMVAVPASAQDIPTTPPQPLAGRDSFLQNCAPCHGTEGKGDGPSASGLGFAPTALGEYDKIAGRSLLELFDITKNGNMQAMMPPWKSRLDDTQIWDTVAYAWSLHTSAQEIEQGKATYEANCASCHGPDGKGTAAGAPNLADFAVTAGMSQETWAQSLANGKGAMPGFAGSLAETEQRAVLSYVRSLSLAGPFFRGALTKGTGIISGTVTNGTTGQSMPDLTVEMGIWDGSSLVEQRTAQTDATGLYRFTELPTDPGLAYAVRVEYPAGVPYSTDFSTFESGSALDLPISVYETTPDSTGVRAERIHYIVEFDPTAGQILVAELVVFSLDGDRTYVGNESGVLQFTLPPGAASLTINDEPLGGRFVQTANGFVDLLPLTPGPNVRQVLYRYALPYQKGAQDFVRTLSYPAANVNALISDIGQRVSSAELADQGVRQAQGSSYFNLLGQNLPAGTTITIQMTRLPDLTGGSTGATGQMPVSRTLLFILAGVAAGAAVLLVTIPLMRNRMAPGRGTSEPLSEDREGLLDAIAQLDIAFEAGEIPEAAYRDRRLQLKAQLRDLMVKEGPG